MYVIILTDMKGFFINIVVYFRFLNIFALC